MLELEEEIMMALERALTMSDEPIGEHFYCGLTTKIVKGVQDLINHKNTELERLTNLGKLHDKITAYSIAEAIKEFIEKAKDTKFKIGNEYVIYADNLDKIAKEMEVEL